ncbi:MAG: ribosome small subunit-dependent GTPase A [Emergencia sp.]|nr:ribosome small subunit-dependent GTPase A [Emergencia sp.]
MKGLIVKGIGGFYYVKTADGIYQAKGRGIFKKEGITLAVGDNVELEVLPDGDGVINEILPRKNQFIRPPIANVDCFIVVFAAAKPKPNFSIIDKFLIMAEAGNMDAVLCINKCDLASDEELVRIQDIYEGIYPMFFVSAKTGEGIDSLDTYISGKRAAFAGPSGVGKSTITNLIVPQANMETGKISSKTSRGKHTTRHVEIFESREGGLVFDTPGFTSFDILEADEAALSDYYPEFASYKGKCRFDNCRHLKEPDCRVREAAERGEISMARYESYLTNLEQVKKRKKY